eukprot:6211930-Pleurochrysis_carterae.AAC.2
MACFTLVYSITCALGVLLTVTVNEDKPPHLRSVEAKCTRYIDGEPCSRQVVYLTTASVA